MPRHKSNGCDPIKILLFKGVKNAQSKNAGATAPKDPDDGSRVRIRRKMIIDNLGPKLEAWRPLNNAKRTSELLNEMFGGGWSLAQVYRRQQYWIQGTHYYRCGASTSYNLTAIVQWLLENQ